VVQLIPGPLLNTTPGASFDGVGYNGLIPPDTNMAVGPNHIVQWVNAQFAVFDKSGNILPGYPKPGNAFWSGFGGMCQTTNNGDPIAQYDRLADRWVMTQLAFTSISGPNYSQCIAVSTGPDPTGTYNRYEYSFTALNDYPKLGIWPNAYVATYNMFAGGASFTGARACAYDRAAMLAGSAATQICFNTTYASLLPSDLDGATPAPAGSPAFFMNFGTNSLNLWKLAPDFVTPAQSTFTGPINIPVAAFSAACFSFCVPQQGSGASMLDALGDRMMYRLAYRNYGDHESLVANHSVNSGGVIGSRWYEIRDPNAAPVVYQQGTFAPPDQVYRWMGSIAMDGAGNIALGYSASGAGLKPAIRYTGREPADPLGTMQSEVSMIEGTGYQTTYSRWGDYSAMRIDPVDDCTFWYTNEYYKTAGSAWSTRIGSFAFNSCGGPTFTLSAAPPSNAVDPGGSADYTVTVTPSGGFISPVTLSVLSGLPAGASAAFNPNPVIGTPDWTSLLTVSTTAVTPPGSYTLTIQGSDGALTRTTTVELIVNGAGDFSLGAAPQSRNVSAGRYTAYVVGVIPSGTFNLPVDLSISGLPARASASFSPNPVTGPNWRSLLAVRTRARTPPGTYTLTITGTSGALVHSTTVNLVVF
jgi:hypothetical protein